jgi:hypothetical protein
VTDAELILEGRQLLLQSYVYIAEAKQVLGLASNLFYEKLLLQLNMHI